MRASIVLSVGLLCACGRNDMVPPDQGVGDAGASDLSAGPGASCALPIDLTHETMPYAASTADGPSLTANQCEDDSASTPELYFSYDAGGDPVDLLVDVVVDRQFPWDAVVSGRTTCRDITSEIDCADQGGSQHLELLAQTGVVYLIVDGTKTGQQGSQGPFTIQVTRRPIVGAGATCDPQGLTARCGDDLRCDNGQCVATSADLECMTATNLTPLVAGGATASVDGVILPFEPDYYDASCEAIHGWAEKLYRLDVAVPSALSATTDDMVHSDFDTVLALLKDTCDGMEVDCNDDVDGSNGDYRSSLDEALLQPGTYYLLVEPSTLFTYASFNAIPHRFRLTVTLTPGSDDGGSTD